MLLILSSVSSRQPPVILSTINFESWRLSIFYYDNFLCRQWRQSWHHDNDALQWRHNECRLYCLLNRLLRSRSKKLSKLPVTDPPVTDGFPSQRASDEEMFFSISLHWHHNDTIASQITSLTVVYSTVYSDADQRKHQCSASLAFVWGIHRDRWIPRTKGQLRGKCFRLMTSSCDDVIMNSYFPYRSLTYVCPDAAIRFIRILDKTGDTRTWDKVFVKITVVPTFEYLIQRLRNLTYNNNKKDTRQNLSRTVTQK